MHSATFTVRLLIESVVLRSPFSVVVAGRPTQVASELWIPLTGT